MMNFRIALFIVLATIAQSVCKDDEIVQNPGTNSLDVTTMSTPRGEQLKPAENGPVRSALGQPDIDLTTFQLEITGLVASSFSLNWEEIQQWPAVYSDTMLMYCVEGWEVWGNWKGILVEALLQKGSVKSTAKHVLFHCVDGYTTALPISYIEKYNAMLAYEVNGKSLKSHDGFPLRLIAFGKYGYKWAKWVNKLEVIDQSKLGYWENFGYSDRADVPIERRRYYEGATAQPLDY